MPCAAAVTLLRRGGAAAQQPTVDPWVVDADSGVEETDGADNLPVPVDGDGNAAKTWD